MMTKKMRILKKLLKNEGVAALEFALVLPILLLILLGTYEVGAYVYLLGKVQSATVAINDITGRNQMRDCDLQSLLTSSRMFFEPFDINANGRIVVTGVADINDGNGARVTWQKSSSGTASSLIGAPGNSPNLPSGLTVSAGDSAVFVEVFYTYTSAFNTFFTTPQQMYRMAVTKPRLGQMVTLTPCS